jgi:hypothetical protein
MSVKTIDVSSPLMTVDEQLSDNAETYWDCRFVGSLRD